MSLSWFCNACTREIWLQPLLQGRAKSETQNSVSPVARGAVCGTVDEVVGEISPALARVLDVVDRQVQLLEREATDFADEARDHLVGGFGERMPFRPGGRRLGAALHTEEAVGIKPQRTGTQIMQRVECVTHHQPHAGAGGSSQLIEG